MNKQQRMHSIAAIVVLATIVTAALIADIVGTAADTSRFLGAIGILSLLGLVRHGISLIRSYQEDCSAILDSDHLSS